MSVDEAVAAVEALLAQERLNDLQESIVRQAWEQRSYPEMAAQLGYAPSYVKYVAFQLWRQLSEALGERVTKSNFQAALRRWQARSGQTAWGRRDRAQWAAADVPAFYGRETELAALDRWILTERCRAVALLGLGGTGKTALAAKWLETASAAFDRVAWRSLAGQPSVEMLLADLCAQLGDQRRLPSEGAQQIARLLALLQQQRCLLVLDSAETILAARSAAAPGCPAGHYASGCERYADLIQQLAESSHQSCLLLASREKPKEIAALEGEALPVRSLLLGGLAPTPAQAVVQDKGRLRGTQTEWTTLVQRCGGNPLALKLAATTVRDIFEGDLSAFLAEGAFIFGDIKALLDRHFERLSRLEQELAYWLAINRAPVALTELQGEILSNLRFARLLEGMESLERRCWIRHVAAEAAPTGEPGCLTLQPLLRDYVTDRLIEQVAHEIACGEAALLHRYALIVPDAPAAIRQQQLNALLAPVSEQLLQALGTPLNVKSQLERVLGQLDARSPLGVGYAAENALNVLHQLNFDLSVREVCELAPPQVCPT